MAYNKHTWMTQELITSDKLNNIEEGISNVIGNQILDANNYGVSVNNDDNSTKLNDLFSKASSNSETLNIVYIPSGKYNVKNDLVFKSNMILYMEKDTILYGPGKLFKFPSAGKGYGNGVNNTTIIGGIFAGDYINGGAFSGSLHHAKNIKFKNVTFNQTTANTHTLDLSGCIDILVDNCEFNGFNIEVAGRDYVEAIQVDYSNVNGLTDKSQTELDYVDGLPTKNVTVVNSTFAPIYNSDGSIKYTAPNAIGEHSSFSNGNPANILFDNNTIIDAASYNSTNPISGWVHFYGVDNLTLTNNKFINNTHNAAIAIQASVSTTDALPSAGGTNLGTVYDIHRNVNIDGNYFIGFKSPTNVQGIIFINGNSVRTPDNNLRITNNIIEDSYPDTADKFNPSIANGTDFIRVGYIDSCVVSKNYMDGGRRFLYIRNEATNFDNTYVVTDNVLKNIYYVPVSANDLNARGYVGIYNNELKDVNGAFSLTNVNLVNVSNNNIFYRPDGKILSGQPLYNVNIQMSRVDTFKFSNNISKQSTTYKYDAPYSTINTANVSENDNLNINF